MARLAKAFGAVTLTTRMHKPSSSSPNDEPYYFPPGHFYSPYVDVEEVRLRAESIYDFSADVPGIDLRIEAQFDLLLEIADQYASFPYGPDQSEGLRYNLDNGMFGASDASLLYCLLLHLAPRRVIEIGSGWSSGLMLDVAESLGDESFALTLIEPNTQRLREVLAPEDLSEVEIAESRLEDVDLELFDTLGSGDVLFVDSTHVAKAGSDVNTLFFDVLPRLASGVVVHIHDVFYPFEYPLRWLEMGRAWSESYLLRAFLQFNDEFEILLFGHLMHLRAHGLMAALFPQTLNNRGASFWMRRA